MANGLTASISDCIGGPTFEYSIWSFRMIKHVKWVTLSFNDQMGYSNAKPEFWFETPVGSLPTWDRLGTHELFVENFNTDN